MIRAILKFLIFASFILLLGQIPWRGRPIAEQFQRSVLRLTTWGGNEIRRSRYYAGFSDWTGLKWNENRSLSNEPKESAASDENVSAADRDSILRLLQN